MYIYIYNIYMVVSHTLDIHLYYRTMRAQYKANTKSK